MSNNHKPKRYIKKPAEVEAIQWTGKNYVDICLFMGREALTSSDCSEIIIYTIEDVMKAGIGDYIIKSIDGEFSTCIESVFNEMYKEVK